MEFSGRKHGVPGVDDKQRDEESGQARGGESFQENDKNFCKWVPDDCQESKERSIPQPSRKCGARGNQVTDRLLKTTQKYRHEHQTEI